MCAPSTRFTAMPQRCRAETRSMLAWLCMLCHQTHSSAACDYNSSSHTLTLLFPSPSSSFCVRVCFRGCCNPLHCPCILCWRPLTVTITIHHSSFTIHHSPLGRLQSRMAARTRQLQLKPQRSWYRMPNQTRHNL